MTSTTWPPALADPDLEGWAWIHALTANGTTRGPAIERLRVLLVSVAWFELERRGPQLQGATRQELASLARDAADAASVNLLERLRDYRGQSRFAVWASKFALHEAAAAVRRRCA